MCSVPVAGPNPLRNWTSASAYTRPSICMESNFVTPCCQPPGVGQAFQPDICRDKRVSPERLAYMGTLTITGLRPECLIGKAALATGRHHGHFHVRPSPPPARQPIVRPSDRLSWTGPLGQILGPVAPIRRFAARYSRDDRPRSMASSDGPGRSSAALPTSGAKR